MQNDVNKFNQYLYKNYYVNPQKEIVISGIMPRISLSELEQEQLIKEIGMLVTRIQLGEEPSIMQQLCLSFLFEGTY
mgnify:FL=1